VNFVTSFHELSDFVTKLYNIWTEIIVNADMFITSQIFFCFIVFFFF